MNALPRSRVARSFFAFSVAALASFYSPDKVAAQPLPTSSCAWPLAWTASGLGNWLFPDTGNRWWYMPIDPQWESLTITGTYPKARFFSFAVYDGAPVATALADHLFDAETLPDPGGVNPFRPDAGSEAGSPTYTISVTRSESMNDNALRLHAETGWLLYRLYLPNGGEGSMGGVPLPSVSFTDASGQVTALPTCRVVNRQSELATLTPQFVPPLLEDPPTVSAVPDHIWFAPVPQPPIRLLPNPDNKYLLSYFMSDYQPGRVILVRGRMAGFPDTYRNAPAWQPAPGFSSVQLRYWSMCVASLVSPLPINACTVDAETSLDAERFYTIVISNDLIRPDWLPPEYKWLPWGDEQMSPKTIFLRSTLPTSDFTQTAQEAVAQGCGVEFNFPTPPSQDGITDAGQCARDVMGDYYPVAVWCDRDLFTSKGWKACFEEAGVE